jgi:hypothetical protein
MRGLLYDFPLFDGGMFYAMIGDVQAHGYRLPEFTSYNGGAIPFDYPPLAFYLAAVLNDVFGISRVTLMQLLPAVASAATVGAFYLLAERLLKSYWAVLVATFAFATLPASFSWMIVGGGLTRSLGFLFAVLALGQLHKLYAETSPRQVAITSVFVSLTVLTHLEMTLFLGISAVVMFLFFGNTREGIRASVAVVAITLIATAPWWAIVLSRDGLAPWLDTGSSRPIVGIGSIAALFKMDLARPALVDLIGLLAVLGLIFRVIKREFFLPSWVLALAIFMPWVFTRLVSVPAALLVGYVMVEYVWPWMRDGLPGMSLRRPPPAWLAPYFVVFFVVSSGFSGVQADRYVLVDLSSSARDAMHWTADNTAPDAKFLVVTGRAWYQDHVSEWFPTLAERTSAGTIQGREWFGSFQQQVDMHGDLEKCAAGPASCLERWSGQAGEDFGYIYVSRESPPELSSQGVEECCAGLRTDLLHSQGYKVVYENKAATIFERVSPSNAP